MRIERLIIPGLGEKIPGPVKWVMGDVHSTTYEVSLDEGDEPKEVIQGVRALQEEELARAKALLKQRWSREYGGAARREPQQPQETTAAPQARVSPERSSDAPTAKQREFLAKLRKEATDAGVDVSDIPQPTHRQEASDQVDAIKTRIRAKTGQSIQSGHDNQDYPQGAAVPAGSRRCSLGKACSHADRGTAKAVRAIEWDYSIRKHGRPLCRTDQEKGA